MLRVPLLLHLVVNRHGFLVVLVDLIYSFLALLLGLDYSCNIRQRA
jgi:hypothetical protein